MKKKTRKPEQLPLFNLTPSAQEELQREKVTRWYYLASPRNSRMVMMGCDGMYAAQHNLAHDMPWVTNSKKLAREYASKFPGTWLVKLYPYVPLIPF